MEGLVVGARDGFVLCFLLLLQFSLEEKIQHLTYNEDSVSIRSFNSSPHGRITLFTGVVRLHGMRLTNITFDLDDFVLLFSHESFVRVQIGIATFRGLVARSGQGHSYSG